MGLLGLSDFYATYISCLSVVSSMLHNFLLTFCMISNALVQGEIAIFKAGLWLIKTLVLNAHLEVEYSTR